MEKYKLSNVNQIISDILLNNNISNYIVTGNIIDLIQSNNKQIYLLIVDEKNMSKNELKYITDITSICIKYFKENNIFNIDFPIYFKYNNYLCKFKVINNQEKETKFELKLNMI